jgi:hypothetical protein
MGEASPIGSVLGTKPASSLELYALELNKYAPREEQSSVQDMLLDISALSSSVLLSPPRPVAAKESSTSTWTRQQRGLQRDPSERHVALFRFRAPHHRLGQAHTNPSP